MFTNISYKIVRYAEFLIDYTHQYVVDKCCRVFPHIQPFKKINRNLQYQIFKMVLKDKTAFIGILGMGAITGILVYFVLFPIGIPVPGVINSVSRQDLPPEELAEPKQATAAETDSSVQVSTSATLEILQGSSVQGNPDYSPDIIEVKKGEAVNVVNKDSVPHTVTNGKNQQDPESAKLFDTGIIMGDESAVLNTDSLAVGDYPFYCTVHPYMTGTLTVQ